VDEEARRELEATVAARRELGPSHDEQLIAGFLERLEHRVEQRPSLPAQREEEDDARGMSFVVALVSLGCGIPITAIAIHHSLAALIVVWIGIVCVNVAFSRAPRSPARRR
jgi:hypothetical protein